jgi:hypothetical protein
VGGCGLHHPVQEKNRWPTAVNAVVNPTLSMNGVYSTSAPTFISGAPKDNFLFLSLGKIKIVCKNFVTYPSIYVIHGSTNQKP